MTNVNWLPYAVYDLGEDIVSYLTKSRIPRHFEDMVGIICATLSWPLHAISHNFSFVVAG